MAQKNQVGWRKTRYGLNWAKGRNLILNISSVYKVNSLVGHKVTLYNLPKDPTLKRGKVLKVTKTKTGAIKFIKDYIKKNG